MRFNPAELHMAIMYKNFDAVTRIVESSPKLDYLWRGASPVSCALYVNALNILDYLIKQGANVNIRTQDYKMEPPLFAACRIGHLDAVKILLKSPNLDIDQKDFFNRTPLWAAARRSSYQIVELLLNHGANVRAAKNFVECPLLQSLCQSSSSKIPHLLVKRGCLLDWKNKEGTPLYFSVKLKDRQLFSLLIRAGCCVSTETWLNNKKSHSIWIKDEAFYNSVIDLIFSPNSLLHLSSCAIRNALVTNHKNLFPKHVQQLPIPTVLKKFILLED